MSVPILPASEPARTSEDSQELVLRTNGQILTSSPAGIAAASAVTPDKLANLLLTEGPLAIRHLTLHLLALIPGFANLSLSKQRRLIILALDSGDPVTGCVFEKVGWGQWAAKRVGQEQVLARQAEANAAEAAKPERPSEAFGWRRRESITTPANDVHADIKPRLPRASFSGKLDFAAEEEAIASLSEDELATFSDDEEDGVANKFQFHETKPNVPLLQLRSLLRSHRALFKGIAKPKVRSRLSSFNATEDGLPEELRRFRSQLFKESFVRRLHLPTRRILISSITNEENTPLPARAPVSESVVLGLPLELPSNRSDTDEEDWAAIGADLLRRAPERPSILENEAKLKARNVDYKEEAAAYALVNLSGM